MKIAVWHNLPSGGGSRALHQHIKGLAERGHHLEVWTSSLADSRYLDVDRYVAQTHVLPLDMTLRIRHKYRDQLRALAFLPDMQMERMIDFCRRCAVQINQGDFDILFANSDVIFMMPYIGRFIRIPKLLYLQEPNRSLYEAFPKQLWEGLAPLTEHWREKVYRQAFWNDLFRIRQARVRVREEIANYQHYDRILVNSYFSSESLARAYGLPGEVCYLGIDTDEFPYQNQPRQPFVLGLGAFFPHKRPDTAIEALARMPKAIRPPLVWIGNMANQEYVAHLQQLARQHDVVFEPRSGISQAELVHLLNTASCLLYTSSLEPFGYAPLEGNACGLPTVAVAEGGIRETVLDEQNGLLVPRDPARLAQALERVLTDETLAQTLSANGRRIVQEHWTIERAVDRIETALVTTIKGKKPAVQQPV